MRKKRMVRKPRSMFHGVMLGAIVSILLSMSAIAVVAYLVSSNKLGQAAMGAIVMVIVAISTAVGGLVSSAVLKEKRGMASALTAAAYFAVLIITNVVFFGGEFQAFGKTLLMILLGVGVALLPVLRKSGGKRIHKFSVNR